MKHVIIGNGGAGISALEAIRSIDPDSEITIITREGHLAYSPCSLPSLLSGSLERDEIFRFSNDIYKDQRAELLMNSEVASINPDDHSIELSDGSSIEYDRLLISAGARPIVPEMDGIDLDGVHIMGSLDSTNGIVEHLKRGIERAVIVGGGFMGIETATAIRETGVEVVVVEMLPHVLQRVIDPDVSVRVESLLTAGGIDLRLGGTVEAIVGDGQVSGVRIAGELLDCDMVVFAIGVSPNTSLVEGSGIEMNRGILVDTRMRTNFEDIFAAGDIAEVHDVVNGVEGVYAIWPNAIDQGWIAGSNMAGSGGEYDGAQIVNVLDVFDTSVVSIGATSSQLTGIDSVERDTAQYFKKLIFRDGRIVGLQFVNTIYNLGQLHGLMRQGADVGDLKDRILDDAFVLGPAVTGPETIRLGG